MQTENQGYYSYNRETELDLEEQRDRLIAALVLTGFAIGVGALLVLGLASRARQRAQEQRTLGAKLRRAAEQGRETANKALNAAREVVGRLSEEVNERIQAAVR